MDNEQPAVKQDKNKLPSWVNKRPLFIWPFLSVIVAAPFALVVDGGAGMLAAFVFAPVEFILSFLHIPTGVFFAKINYEEIKKGHSWVVIACLVVASAIMAILLTLLSVLIRGPHPRSCFDTCSDMSMMEIVAGPIIVSILFLVMSLAGAARYIYLVKTGLSRAAESSEA